MPLTQRKDTNSNILKGRNSFLKKQMTLSSNVANVGGLQIPGVKGEVVVLYFEPLATQNMKASGSPEG